MTKLKQKILASLNNDAQLEHTLSDLTNYQQNLLKNYSNDILNKTEKNRVLKAYTDLSEINKSLNRYNNLKQDNYLEDAQEQKEEISDMVLKGGISNYKYIWHSEQGEHTCEKCKALDGTVYELWDDIPQQPHSNCKCYIEVVEIDDVNSDNIEYSDMCNCDTELENIIEELENEIQTSNELDNNINDEIAKIQKNAAQIKVLIENNSSILKDIKPELGEHLKDCPNYIDDIYGEIYAKQAKLETLLVDILGLLNPLGTLLNTVRVFVSNYIALLHEAYVLKEAGMDKFRHAKANCEATQQMGILGEMTATGLSNLKEYYDQYTYVHTHHVSIEEAIADSERDQIANKLGRERGRKYPYCSCSILMHDLLPDYKK